MRIRLLENDLLERSLTSFNNIMRKNPLFSLLHQKITENLKNKNKK